MKQFLMAVLIAISMCFTAHSQTQNKNSGKMSKAEQEIMALNRLG